MLASLAGVLDRLPGGAATDSAKGDLRLTRRRVYIFHTRAGFAYLVMLLVMLVGAINYTNSMAYGLTFLLAALFFVLMVVTTRNLIGLRYAGGNAAPVFAGEHAQFAIQVQYDSTLPRSGIRLRPAALKQRWFSAAFAPDFVAVNFSTSGSGTAVLPVPAQRRGWLTVSRLELQTTFPSGLLVAWAFWRPGLRCLVYPRAHGDLPLPMAQAQARSDGGSATPTSGGEDFYSLREYRGGDSLKHVAWKNLARSDQLLTKEMSQPAQQELILSWQHTAALGNVETRLSQLAQWLCQAHTLHLTYALELPARSCALNSGSAHRDDCLRALALYGLDQ